jgi:uncharacterized repeat protein (TIGR03803 family)
MKKSHTNSRILSTLVFFFTALVPPVTTAWGQANLTVLENFSNVALTNSVSGPLFRDAAGNLYGAGEGGIAKLSRKANGTWEATSVYAGDLGGAYPNAVIMDASGNLYGTTMLGGAYNNHICAFGGDGFEGCGTVYELSPTPEGGWLETVLYEFTDGKDGDFPTGSLIIDTAGNLYGTANGGQGTCYSSNNPVIDGCGVVFELSPGANGTWTEKTLYSFTGGADGGAPANTLSLDQSGNLYGATLMGGNNSLCSSPWQSPGCGVVFEISPKAGNWSESVLYAFKGESDGTSPTSGVVIDAEGNLYGEAAGGTLNGVVYELSPTSEGNWTETVLNDFSTESSPFGGLTFDAAGNLYGATYYGASEVFELSPAAGGIWSYSVVHAFTGIWDGSAAFPVVLDSAGNVYGTTVYGGGNCGMWSGSVSSGCGVAYEVSKTDGKWKETVLYDNHSGAGMGPSGGVVEDAFGNFYGTTSAGGDYAWGTIYETSPVGGGWKTKTIYNFKGETDGGVPVAGLTIDAAGNLYGTTVEGGSSNCLRGCGSVFKLNSTGSEKWVLTVLHDFQGEPRDGSNPVTSVVLDDAGNVYGTTPVGGTDICNGNGGNYSCGTVFEISPSGTGWRETILHNFGYTDGADPMGLTIDGNGNLYSTSYVGGEYHTGVAFELAGASHSFSVLYTFGQRKANGENPTGGLIVDDLGNLYGTAEEMVFELTPSSGGTWQETVLTTAFGQSVPYSKLVLNSSGSLFGLATGVNAANVIFEVSPKASGGWTEQTYLSLNYVPVGNLLMDSAGNLYGIGSESNNQGELYEVTP